MAEKKKSKKSDEAIEKEENTAAQNEEAEIADETVKNADSDKEQSEVNNIEKERDMYLEMLRRERADFENYKKRNASLSAAAFTNGSIDTVEKILPVVDNFERALQGSENSEDSFTVGINMIYRQLVDALNAIGVSEIEALGKPFDPEFMNAVMQAERGEGEESGIVSEVFQKGYKLKDRIIRHAMVKVTN